MPTFVNIVGYNGTGKTTLAKRLEEYLGFNRINGDAFRLFVINEIAYFKDLDLSHQNDRHEYLSPLVVQYRTELSLSLLRAGENVIMEGSGLLKSYRELYLHKIKQQDPKTKTVLIVCKIAEDKLADRLRLRDASTQDESWQIMHKAKENIFEMPTEDEADAILIYSQDNYDDIKSKLKDVMEAA